MIVKRGKRYVLKSKGSGRTLGVHPSREAAERQETAINMSKARAAGHKLPPPPDERGETMRKIRSGKAKFLVPLVLAALASSAFAANVSCPSGYLTAPTGQNATGPSVNTVTARAAPALAFQLLGGGTSATVQLEMCCGPLNCNLTSAWAPVQGSVATLTAGSFNAAASVLDPTCMYRANVTACTSCSVTVVYACSGAH